jgi:hypothetical protein
MPFKIVEKQKRFTFTVNGAGLPVAHVERWGAGVWLTCCPLCGMVHEVLKGQTSGEFDPKCIVRTTHPHVFAAWQKAHPEAARYTRVLLELKPLQMTEGNPCGIAPYVAPAKPKKVANSASKPAQPVRRSQAKNLRKLEIPAPRARKAPETAPRSESEMLAFVKVTDARVQKPAESAAPSEAKSLRKPKVSARVEKRKRARRSQPPKVAPAATP